MIAKGKIHQWKRDSNTMTSPIIDVPYRQLIGGLMYLSTSTRPDITFSVSYLSRFLDKPTSETWQAGKRVL